jgi:hypothetical protein
MNAIDKYFLKISKKILFLKVFRFNVKFFLMKYFPRIVHIISKMKYPRTTFSSSTEITMDGFQRSGNSFATYQFMTKNKTLNIAHHRHINTQIIFSAQNKIPTIVFIRDPIDAIISAFFVQESAVPLEIIIRSWINFYEPILRYKNEIIISDFKNTINNFDQIIYQLNKKYDSNFLIPKIDKNTYENYSMYVEKLQIKNFGKLDNNRMSKPNDTRINKKQSLIDKIKKENIVSLKKSYDIYNFLVKKNN